jgi:hypothetical protein
MSFTTSFRSKYSRLRREAGEMSVRDKRFDQIRELFIHDVDYEFDTEKYQVDARIPKGGILKAIRDVS